MYEYYTLLNSKIPLLSYPYITEYLIGKGAHKNFNPPYNLKNFPRTKEEPQTKPTSVPKGLGP